MASERRRKQVARRIQQKLAEVLLFRMKDPRAAFITITGVEVTADLLEAKVRWSALESGTRSRIEAMLTHAHGFLRTEVARDLDLRNAPQLRFEYDRGPEQAERIERKLREVLPPEERGDGGGEAPTGPDDD